MATKIRLAYSTKSLVVLMMAMTTATMSPALMDKATVRITQVVPVVAPVHLGQDPSRKVMKPVGGAPTSLGVDGPEIHAPGGH